VRFPNPAKKCPGGKGSHETATKIAGHKNSKSITIEQKTPIIESAAMTGRTLKAN
jgi:hypothetical protein